MNIRKLLPAGIWLCLLLLSLNHPAAAGEAVKTVTFTGLYGRPAKPVRRAFAEDILPLPRAANTEDYTFLGWALKPGRKTDPDYLEYQRVRLLQNLTLYGVYYPNKEEKDLAEENFASLDTDRYKLVIFAGDSRFASARRKIGKELGERFMAGHSAYVLAQSDISLAEFVENRSNINLESLTTTLESIPGIDQPTAVVVNLGTNDLRHIRYPEPVIEPFLQNLQKLADSLAPYRVKLFYMSVNPVSGEALARRNYAIWSFNRSIRERLPEAYTYIDTYSWLMKTGFTPRSPEDGVHYSLKTGKRIFDYAIRFLNTH